MNKDKQIEEMARALNEANGFDDIPAWYDDFTSDAEALYNIGYRKASEVAEDIFQRLYQHIKFDGHTVAVWKNDLLCIAKEYDVNLE